MSDNDKFHCPHCSSVKFSCTVSAVVVASFYKDFGDEQLKWEAETEAEPCWNDEVKDMTCINCGKVLTTQKLIDAETYRLNKKEW